MRPGRIIGAILLWLGRQVLAAATLAVTALAAAWPESFAAGFYIPWWIWVAGLNGYWSWALWRQFRQAAFSSRQNRQLEFSLLAGLTVVLANSGGVYSPLLPLLYLLLVVVGGFDHSLFNRLAISAGAAAAVAALALGGRAPLSVMLVQLVAVLAIPWAVWLTERFWLQAKRAEVEARVRAELEKTQREAEEYRLIGLTAVQSELAPEKRREDLLRSSVQQLGLGLENILGILEASLRPHVVAVYWLSEDGKSLTLKAALPAAERALLLEGPLPSLGGFPGAVIQSARPLRRNNLRKGERGLSYYRQEVPIKTFLAVPVVEGGENKHLRGVLLADRRVDVPFGDDDERLLEVAARELVRYLNTERQLNGLDQLRMEAEGLYQASEGLMRASSVQEVAEETAASLRQLFHGADLAAVVLAEGEKHLVLKAVDASEAYSAWREQAVGQIFKRSSSLCVLAMEKGMILPDHDFDGRSRSQKRILDDRQDPPGLRSVKVAPLKVPGGGQAAALGALILGCQASGFFGGRLTRTEDVRRTLETFSNISAIGFLNAQRLEKLEQMATTDALTGLFNRRRFFEMLGEAAADALRYSRPLSLLMTDIDHFKSINDTYGHPTGDEVLRRVARVLTQMARATDRVCRVGGEEFAVLAPQTDGEGARQLAERFREAVGEQEFQQGGKQFSVTLSLGVCTMPHQARDEQELVQRADQALYRAKNGGRNQVVLYSVAEQTGSAPA